MVVWQGFRLAFPSCCSSLRCLSATASSFARKTIGALAISSWGTIPMPGWDADAGWENQPVPFEDMPHLVNPEAGFVATANNQPTLDDDGPFLGIDWLDGYRHGRIVEALDSRHDWDLASVQRLQMDQVSLPWRDMRDVVLNAPARSEEARQAVAMLGAWDGVVAADSPAATVFELFVEEMVRRMVEAKAPRAARWARSFACLTTALGSTTCAPPRSR